MFGSESFTSVFAFFSVFSFAGLSEAATTLPEKGFIENEAPFLRSAMVFDTDGKPNRTRRGVILPVGHGFWACFDPDLLRWSAVWKPEPGTPPISYDSMAAVSFPDEKAKATKPPSLKGKPLHVSPELPGVSTGNEITSDPRENFLIDRKNPVGPLPSGTGKWHGISLRKETPVLHYQIDEVDISERISTDEKGNLQRCLRIGPSSVPITFRLLSASFRTEATNASIDGNQLHLNPSPSAREILLFEPGAASLEKITIPDPQPATPVFPEAVSVVHAAAVADGPFTIRNIRLPETSRVIRPTDLAFLSDGTALLTTFDGDVWRIEGIESEKSTWTRVASGIFEPMSIATTADDRTFVLGRDQITELFDTNGDGFFDIFKCAADQFLQTLHTRDYATSLEVDKDGSFLIAKGGINNSGKAKYEEVSSHRGTILRINPENGRVETLADGLRLPYVGLRNDGTVFASDQQGNHVPSTPIHLLQKEPPYLGFAPTDFRSTKKPVEPLLYYPYQTNRSAAAFATTSEKAFSDLANTFVQISWNGRLFGIATPEAGQPFSWNFPLQMNFPTLNAATHPASGRLYVVGLGISGYKPTTPELLGLASIEQTHPIPTPATFDVSQESLTIRFKRPLAADETVVPGSPALRLFNVKRTPKYGSGHYKWNEKPGEHHFQPSSLQLSPDRTTLRLEFDQIRKSDILHLSLNVSSGDITVPLDVFSHPDHLPKASTSDLDELARQEKSEPALTPGDPAKGKQLFTQFSCVGCHSLTGEKLTGPPLNDLAVKSNEKQIRESIIDPTARITEGYPPSMPSFEGVIPPQDLEHLIAYLLTLKN